MNTAKTTAGWATFRSLNGDCLEPAPTLVFLCVHRVSVVQRIWFDCMDTAQSQWVSDAECSRLPAAFLAANSQP